MERDFEDIFDTADLDDDEVRALIHEKLTQAPSLDNGFIEVNVEDGAVTLNGRVGTEEEYQRLEQILADELGIDAFENNIVVDQSVRVEEADAADVASAEAREEDDELGGEPLVTEPSAQHLAPDTEGELYGTHDLGKAIESGESYDAPDQPPQMGSEGLERH